MTAHNHMWFLPSPTYLHQPHRMLGNIPPVHWPAVQTTSFHCLYTAHGWRHRVLWTAHQIGSLYTHTKTPPGKDLSHRSIVRSKAFISRTSSYEPKKLYRLMDLSKVRLCLLREFVIQHTLWIYITLVNQVGFNCKCWKKYVLPN